MKTKKKIFAVIFTAVLILFAAVYVLYKAKNNKDAEDYISQVQILIEEKKYDQAIQQCTQGLKEFPEQVQLYILKSQAYICEGDNAKAAGTLDYGYKQTGDERLIKLKEEYDDQTDSEQSSEFFEVYDNEEIYTPSQEESDGDDFQKDEVEGETYKEYTTTTTIEISIPKVSTSQTQTDDSSSQQDE